MEVGKGLLQVLVIGVLGTVLKLFADAYHARRLAAEQRDVFRREKYHRLVAATNRLRQISILIEANRSVSAWSELYRLLEAQPTL